MVCADSRISHVVETSNCNVHIKGSCGTSAAARKGTHKFGIRSIQDKTIPVALEVLVVHDLAVNVFSVGALAETGVKCDLLQTHPVLRHGTSCFPISTEVPRMDVVNIILDDVNPDGSVKTFPTNVDAHMWHRGWATATRALSSSWQTMTIRASSSTETSVMRL